MSKAEIIDAELARLHEFLEATQGELQACIEVFRETKPEHEQFARRTSIRVMFACIEGYISQLNQTSLFFENHEPIGLTSKEVLQLQELKEVVKPGGATETVNDFKKLEDRFKFSLRTFGRMIRRDYRVNYGHRGGRIFITAACIRNRLTHPKCTEDWEVSERDHRIVRVGFKWATRHLAMITSEGKA